MVTLTGSATAMGPAWARSGSLAVVGAQLQSM